MCVLLWLGEGGGPTQHHLSASASRDCCCMLRCCCSCTCSPPSRRLNCENHLNRRNHLRSPSYCRCSSCRTCSPSSPTCRPKRWSKSACKAATCAGAGRCSVCAHALVLARLPVRGAGEKGWRVLPQAGDTVRQGSCVWRQRAQGRALGGAEGQAGRAWIGVRKGLCSGSTEGGQKVFLLGATGLVPQWPWVGGQRAGMDLQIFFPPHRVRVRSCFLLCV